MVAFRCSEHAVVFDVNHQIIFTLKEGAEQLNIEIWGKTLTLTPTQCLLDGEPFGEILDATDGAIHVELPSNVSLDVVFRENRVSVAIFKGKVSVPSEAVVIEKFTGTWGVVATDAYRIYDILMDIATSPAYLQRG